MGSTLYLVENLTVFLASLSNFQFSPLAIMPRCSALYTLPAASRHAVQGSTAGEKPTLRLLGD